MIISHEGAEDAKGWSGVGGSRVSIHHLGVLHILGERTEVDSGTERGLRQQLGCDPISSPRPLRSLRLCVEIFFHQTPAPKSAQTGIVRAGVGRAAAVPSGMEESPGSIGQGAR